MESDPNYRGGTADLVRPPDAPEPGGYTEETADRQLRSQSRDEVVPLLSDDKSEHFRDRWEECQRGFVDEPRASVEQADQLVADLIRDLATQFAEERSRLEEQWSRGEEVSTDDLRFALQRYRSFFNRLLQV